MESKITINDLLVIAQIIELATKRGAIHAGEMSDVGAVYTKLTTYLTEVKKASEMAELEGMVPEATVPEAAVTEYGPLTMVERSE